MRGSGSRHRRNSGALRESSRAQRPGAFVMSAVGDRLRTLQRQVGSASDQSPLLGLRNELHRLIRRRERSSFVALPAPAGIEIADGLRLVEQRWAADGSDTVWLTWSDPIDVDRERLVCFDTESAR